MKSLDAGKSLGDRITVQVPYVGSSAKVYDADVRGDIGTADPKVGESVLHDLTAVGCFGVVVHQDVSRKQLEASFGLRAGDAAGAVETARKLVLACLRNAGCSGATLVGLSAVLSEEAESVGSAR